MRRRANRYVSGTPTEVEDNLVVEQALQVTINGQPHTLTMRTPGNDSSLVAGLLFTEKIIGGKSDILFYEERACNKTSFRMNAEVHLNEELAARARRAGRSMMSSASCGMCGKTDADALDLPDRPLTHDLKLEVTWLEEMQRLVAAQQELFKTTGGCHAAAAFSIDGELLCVMEDIGRHNAVDKVVGYLLLNDLLDRADLLSVSGRVSYEIAAKLYAASIPYLVSVSAPSSLAVEVCESVGITLISFCRGNRATVATHDHAVVGAVSVAG